MVKKLTKHGNSLALIIDKSMLEALKINNSTELEIKIEDGNLIVRPILRKKKTLKKSEVDKIVDKIIEKYDPVLRKLSKT